MPTNNSAVNVAAPVPYEHVIFTDLDGLEGILVDLNTRKYYQLNETASLIWRGILRRMAVNSIALEMTERYDVTMPHAVSSIEASLRHFAAKKLVGPPDSP